MAEKGITEKGKSQIKEVEKFLSNYKYRKDKNFEHGKDYDVFYVRGKNIGKKCGRDIYVEYVLRVTYEHNYLSGNHGSSKLTEFRIDIVTIMKSSMNKTFVCRNVIKTLPELKKILDDDITKFDTSEIGRKMMYSNYFKETRVILREGGGKQCYQPVLKISKEMTELVFRDKNIKETLKTLNSQLKELVMISKV